MTSHEQQTVIKKPGLTLYPPPLYKIDFGDLESNGKKNEGHYITTDENNEEVIAVPDKQVKRVEFNTISSVSRRAEIGKGSDDIHPAFLRHRQATIADSFVACSVRPLV